MRGKKLSFKFYLDEIRASNVSHLINYGVKIASLNNITFEQIPFHVARTLVINILKPTGHVMQQED
jgi:hypothetical protein